MSGVNYDFERLSVLVVDDCQFFRILLARVLRSLGVLQITQAADGSEAINILKSLGQPGHNTGVQRIDLVMCDWIMSPVDGPMLLKWIRRHKESPNRFMAFIMMTALAEPERVLEARALGAHEFLAKPFTIASISNKLTALIERPRNFVLTSDYFGPDRRRTNQAIEFDDRRTTKKEEIEIIHSGKVPSQLKEGIKMCYLKPPTQIKDLVAGLGGGSSGGEKQGFSTESLQDAQESIANLENDYSDWVMSSIQTLNQAYHDLKNAERNYHKYYKIINEIAHDLRGQGDTFGYNLITTVSKSLFQYTQLRIEPEPNFIDLLKNHIDIINIVIRDKIRGDGGELGKKILESLRMAKQRYEQLQAAGRRG